LKLFAATEPGAHRAIATDADLIDLAVLRAELADLRLVSLYLGGRWGSGSAIDKRLLGLLVRVLRGRGWVAVGAARARIVPLARGADEFARSTTPLLISLGV